MKLLLTLLIFLLHQSILKSQIIQNWVGRYGNTVNSAYTVAGPVIDKSGNVFVGGSVTTATLTDYVTIKYNSSGAEEWSRVYTGLIEHRLIDMVLDNTGNLYVTGLSENMTGTYDIITIKYNTFGDSLWVKRYNGATAFTMDQPVAMDIDASNNVYVTGYSFGSIPMSYVTIKYSPQGDSLWVARFVSDGTDLSRDIYIDNEGNAIVYARGTRIIKYDTNGNVLWNRTYSFDASEFNKVLTGDASGNIYFTGTKFSSTFDDFAVVKLNSNGDISWSQVRNGFGGTAPTHDDARAICVDNSGNVFITGEIYEATGFYNFSTIKYNSSGIFQWERNYSHPQSGDGGNDIVCDNSGNIYVTGGSNDFTTIKYNTNGDSLWVIKYSGSANMNDLNSAIAIDNSNNIYITGRSQISQSPAKFEIATVKYSQTITNISSEVNSEKSFKLYQNYPNPFNPNTKINYELPASRQGGQITNYVSLKVYDVSGNEISTLINQKQNSESYSVEFDGDNLPSGVYFYKIEIISDREIYSDVKKMILLR